MKKNNITLVNPPFLLNQLDERVSATRYINNYFRVLCIHLGLITSYLRTKNIPVKIYKSRYN